MEGFNPGKIKEIKNKMEEERKAFAHEILEEENKHEHGIENEKDLQNEK